MQGAACKSGTFSSILRKFGGSADMDLVGKSLLEYVLAGADGAICTTAPAVERQRLYLIETVAAPPMLTLNSATLTQPIVVMQVGGR